MFSSVATDFGSWTKYTNYYRNEFHSSFFFFFFVCVCVCVCVCVLGVGKAKQLNLFSITKSYQVIL